MANTQIPPTDYKTEFIPGTVKAAIAAVGAKSGDVWMVPLDNLVVPSGLNVRIHDADYEERVDEVKDSILANGFYKHMPLPGFVGKEGDQQLIYIVGGFTRLEAARRAAKEDPSLETVPVVLKPGGTSMADLTLALAMDNTGRPLKPYERSIVVKRLTNFGWEEDEIAKKMTVSGEYVKQLLFMQSLPNAIHKMVINGEVSVGHAVDMAKRHGASEAVKILAAALKPGNGAADGAGSANGAANGATARTRVTPRQTRSAGAGKGGPSKKMALAAIDFAIALPTEGIEFLNRWRKGEKDALAEVAAMSKPPRKAKAKKAKAKAKRKTAAKRPRKTAAPVAPNADDIDL